MRESLLYHMEISGVGKPLSVPRNNGLFYMLVMSRKVAFYLALAGMIAFVLLTWDLRLNDDWILSARDKFDCRGPNESYLINNVSQKFNGRPPTPKQPTG